MIIGLFGPTAEIIALIETASEYANQVLPAFDATDQIIAVTCSGSRLRSFMVDRCEKRGKVFNDTYWDTKRLEYEASGRLLNYLSKNLSHVPTVKFKIEEQSVDWETVDDYFGSLYRRLNNLLVRRRK